MTTNQNQQLPAIIKTERQIKQRNLVRSLKELQAAKIHLIAAYTFCDGMKLQDIGMHLRKITKDINTISNHLHQIYKKEPIVYNDVNQLYESLETVIGEMNE
jgi:hypothetical protein